MKKALKIVVATMLVFSMTIVCLGCGKTENKKEKETKETTTEAPTEPESRVPLIPIKGLGNLKFGMIESEVKETVENDPNFEKTGEDEYKYHIVTKDYDVEAEASFSYDDYFLDKVEFKCKGTEGLNDDVFEKYSKLYKVQKDRERVTALGYYYIASGLYNSKVMVIITYGIGDHDFSLCFEKVK